MQFLAPTFIEVVTRHPLPAGGASPPSRYNPHDAIYAAAFYLCDNHADPPGPHPNSRSAAAARHAGAGRS
nr:hypothetical protein [Frankia nepalensis]